MCMFMCVKMIFNIYCSCAVRSDRKLSYVYTKMLEDLKSRFQVSAISIIVSTVNIAIF